MGFVARAAGRVAVGRVGAHIKARWYSAASRRVGEIAGRRMLYIKVRYKGSIKAACIKLASIRMLTSAPVRPRAALTAAYTEYNLHVYIDRNVYSAARGPEPVLAVKRLYSACLDLTTAYALPVVSGADRCIKGLIEVICSIE